MMMFQSASIPAVVACLLAVSSLVLAAVQWFLGRRAGLHRGPSAGADPAGISLLLPVTGSPACLEAALGSWFAQDDAGPVQILVGVDAADPAARAAVEAVLRGHPGRDARCVACADTGAANDKVSKLEQLYREAHHAQLVVSDDDVIAPRSCLAALTARLADPGVGLVSCLYRFSGARGPAAAVEAVAVNADFWVQVLQARALGMPVALGAVMGIRRDFLERAGGFSAVRDHLADDHQLGRNIARIGGRVEILPFVVECVLQAPGWRGVWRHQMRWARTIRACQPFPWLASIIGNVSLWVVVAGLALSEAGAGLPAAVGLVGVGLGLRVVLARSNEARLTRCPVPWSRAWAVPARDLLGVCVWLCVLVGGRVEWRGRWFRVRRGGRLERC